MDITEFGSHFSFQNKSFSTQLLGAGNVYNCLAAICLVSQMGIDYETQRSAIAEVSPEPGRMEPIRMDGLLVINDTYNANPVSMRAAIDFMARSGRRKILVLGDMLELGTHSEDLHREVGVYAQKYADVLLTHGSEARLYGGRHFSEQSGLLRYLTETIRGDELVLLKASRALRFERIVSAMGRMIR
jgi:UDP-N-acetylmuramoyl-tripeptide--D-alanyl-D-alanine ligase